MTCGPARKRYSAAHGRHEGEDEIMANHIPGLLLRISGRSRVTPAPDEPKTAPSSRRGGRAVPEETDYRVPARGYVGYDLDDDNDPLAPRGGSRDRSRSGGGPRRLELDYDDDGIPDAPAAAAGADEQENEWPPRRLQQLRQRVGMSQEDFAHRYALDVRDIRDWENGAHPAQPTRVLLTLIEYDPDTMSRLIDEVYQP
ncbi:putative transcriptional regulator [uncultured Gammaproteobacteria bacterium]